MMIAYLNSLIDELCRFFLYLHQQVACWGRILSLNHLYFLLDVLNNDLDLLMDTPFVNHLLSLLFRVSLNDETSNIVALTQSLHMALKLAFQHTLLMLIYFVDMILICFRASLLLIFTVGNLLWGAAVRNDFGFLEWAQTDTVFLDYTFSSSLPIDCNFLIL